MSFSLNRYRIKARIYFGFGLLISLGLALAVFGVWQSGNIGRQVGKLAVVSDHMSRTERMIRLAETLRRTALYFKDTFDPAAVEEFTAAASELTASLKAASEDAVSAQRRRSYGDLVTTVGDLEAKFKQLTELGAQLKSARTASAHFGDEVSAAIDRAAELANGKGEPGAVAAARELEVAVLTMRIMTLRVSVNKSAEAVAGFHAAADKAVKTVAAIDPSMLIRLTPTGARY